LHDFVRQPTILDYFVRESALLASTLARGAIMQEMISAQLWLRPDCNRAVARPDTLGFRRQLEKVALQRSASFLVRCRFGGPLVEDCVEKLENRGASKISQMMHLDDSCRHKVCRIDSSVGSRCCCI
jgi:hypothetical protein